MKGRRITIDKIKIAGGPDIKILKGFSYHLEPNQHATATIVGILAEEKDTKEWINSSYCFFSSRTRRQNYFFRISKSNKFAKKNGNTYRYYAFDIRNYFIRSNKNSKVLSKYLQLLCEYSKRSNKRNKLCKLYLYYGRTIFS